MNYADLTQPTTPTLTDPRVQRDLAGFSRELGARMTLLARHIATERGIEDPTRVGLALCLAATQVAYHGVKAFGLNPEEPTNAVEAVLDPRSAFNRTRTAADARCAALQSLTLRGD